MAGGSHLDDDEGEDGGVLQERESRGDDAALVVKCRTATAAPDSQSVYLWLNRMEIEGNRSQ